MKVAEHFYSIQGEGLYAGFPAVFLRLSGCVLNCKWCDTVEVWKTGTHHTEDALLQTMIHIYGNAFAQSKAHLIVTGGDPLIWQVQLISFLQKFRYRFVGLTIELETEGVLKPHDDLFNLVDMFNVSPKLGNSGVQLGDRIKIDVLRYHLMRGKCIFKIPTDGSSEDVREIESLLSQIDCTAKKRALVWLMPLAASRAEYAAVAPKVAEVCKERGFKFSPRLQVEIWDRTTGV